jgi:hypothetical protein
MPKLEVNPFEFDSRMTEWNLKTNKLSKEALQAFLKNLPDDASNCEPVSLDEDDRPTDPR